MVAATTPAFEKGKLYELPITDLRPDPDQPRKHMDPQSLAELASSIRQLGILQPVLFRTGEQGWLILVAGERRFEAAKIAGLFVIPGICVEGSTAEIALVENLQREDLTAVEEAEALGRLVDSMQYTHEQAAGVIGKSRQAVTEILSINILPAEIRDDCRNNNRCPRRILVEIARKKQARSMISLYDKYKKSGLTVGELHKETRLHVQKSELRITGDAARSVVRLKARITALALASIDTAQKDRLVGDVESLCGELEGKLNELTSLLVATAQTPEAT